MARLCGLHPLVRVYSRRLNFHLPGTDAYAGYMMAASGFLALAHTFKRGEHIRVSALLQRMRGRTRRAFELWALAAAALLASLGAWYSVRLAWQSRVFNDVSTSSDATPLWIPQLTMAAGMAILAIAVVDELVLEWRGRGRTRTIDGPAALHE